MWVHACLPENSTFVSSVHTISSQKSWVVYFFLVSERSACELLRSAVDWPWHFTVDALAAQFSSYCGIVNIDLKLVVLGSTVMSLMSYWSLWVLLVGLLFLKRFTVVSAFLHLKKCFLLWCPGVPNPKKIALKLFPDWYMSICLFLLCFFRSRYDELPFKMSKPI